jgi:hypothetical protein
MRASGWNNGSPSTSGAGYGIRISKADRNSYFVPTWTHVQLQFPDGSTARVQLSSSFWKPLSPCSELRSAAIGRWLIAQGLAPWKKGSPPKLVVSPLSNNDFLVKPSG